jgi:hypothetical protein
VVLGQVDSNLHAIHDFRSRILTTGSGAVLLRRCIHASFFALCHFLLSAHCVHVVISPPARDHDSIWASIPRMLGLRRGPVHDHANEPLRDTCRLLPRSLSRDGGGLSPAPSVSGDDWPCLPGRQRPWNGGRGVPLGVLSPIRQIES